MEIKSLSECTPEEKRRALDHALHSRTFARADQLRNFLRYVCEAEMAGATERLTESAIGIEVLRRPKGYTPVEDSSVRTRAYELRHRLEKLYTLESPGREVCIRIPKGPISLATNAIWFWNQRWLPKSCRHLQLRQKRNPAGEKTG